MKTVTLQDIQKAKDTIKDIVKKTDILESVKLSTMTGANIFYKCENLQKTGSFKVRGACNKIANLTEEEKANVTISLIISVMIFGGNGIWFSTIISESIVLILSIIMIKKCLKDIDHEQGEILEAQTV